MTERLTSSGVRAAAKRPRESQAEKTAKRRRAVASTESAYGLLTLAHVDSTGFDVLTWKVLKMTMRNLVTYGRREALKMSIPVDGWQNASQRVMHQLLRLMWLCTGDRSHDELIKSSIDRVEVRFGNDKGLITGGIDVDELGYLKTKGIPVNTMGGYGIYLDEPLDWMAYERLLVLGPASFEDLIDSRRRLANNRQGDHPLPVLSINCLPAYVQSQERQDWYSDPNEIQQLSRDINNVYRRRGVQNQDLREFDVDDGHYNALEIAMDEEEAAAFWRRGREQYEDALRKERQYNEGNTSDGRLRAPRKKGLRGLPGRIAQAERNADTFTSLRALAGTPGAEVAEWKRVAVLLLDVETLPPAINEKIGRCFATYQRHRRYNASNIERMLFSVKEESVLWAMTHSEQILHRFEVLWSQFRTGQVAPRWRCDWLNASAVGVLGVNYADMPMAALPRFTAVELPAILLDTFAVMSALSYARIGQRNDLTRAVALLLRGSRISRDDRHSQISEVSQVNTVTTDLGNGRGSINTVEQSMEGDAISAPRLYREAPGGDATTQRISDGITGIQGNEVTAIRPAASGSSMLVHIPSASAQVNDAIDADIDNFSGIRHGVVYANGDIVGTESEVLGDDTGGVTTTTSTTSSTSTVLITDGLSTRGGTNTTGQREEEDHVDVHIIGDVDTVIGVDATRNTTSDYSNTPRITIEQDDTSDTPMVNLLVDLANHVDSSPDTRRIIVGTHREPLAYTPRSNGPVPWGKTTVIGQNVRLRNFTSYYNEMHSSVEEHIVYAPSNVDEATRDWFTSAIVPNIPWDGVMGESMAGSGLGIRVYKYTLNMMFIRNDNGKLSLVGGSLAGAYIHDVNTTNDAEIRREFMKHEITQDVELDEEGKPVRRVNPDVDSFINIFTDLGGIHLEDGRGARSGFKTWIDSETPRPTGGAVAYPEAGGAPEVRLVLTKKDKLAEIDMPQYSFKSLSTTESTVVLSETETIGGLTTSARDAIHEQLHIPTGITPTTHYLYGDGAQLPFTVKGNMITEMNGILGTGISGALRFKGSSRTIRPTPTEDQIMSGNVPALQNIELNMDGSVGSSVFANGKVKVRVIGWVLPEPSFIWNQEDTDDFHFGEVYVQGTDDTGRPVAKKVNVYDDYNFCTKSMGGNPEYPIMFREALRSLDPYNTPFTIMFDKTVTIGDTSRSENWTFTGYVKHITQERHKVVHTTYEDDGDGGEVIDTVTYEGLTNRLLVSYYPLPVWDVTVNPQRLSCNWFRACVVHNACYWLTDRFVGSERLEVGAVQELENDTIME